MLLLLHLHPGFLILSQLVFSEMLDILWVDQIFHPSVFVVVFLKVVDFIFVFIISVVTWSQLGIGQLFPGADRVDPSSACDQACAGRVEDFEHIENDAVFGIGGGGLKRLVVEAVGATDLIWGPRSIVVEVMEGEEGRRVEIGYICVDRTSVLRNCIVWWLDMARWLHTVFFL